MEMFLKCTSQNKDLFDVFYRASQVCASAEPVSWGEERFDLISFLGICSCIRASFKLAPLQVFIIYFSVKLGYLRY